MLKGITSLQCQKGPQSQMSEKGTSLKASRRRWHTTKEEGKLDGMGGLGSPYRRYVLSSVLQNVVLFGNRVVGDNNSLKWGDTGESWALQSGMTGVLLWGGKRHREENAMWRQRHTQTQREVWTWRQRPEWRCHKPRHAWGYAKLEETQKEAQRLQKKPGGFIGKCGPANTLILDFYLPDLWENTFLLFKATQFTVLCNGSPRKLT